MANRLLLQSVHATRKNAQEARRAARETRIAARTLMLRAISLCRNVDDLDHTLAEATRPVQIKRKMTVRDETLDALRQSLSDLESLRMVKSDERAVSQVKDDIRKTLERARYAQR